MLRNTSDNPPPSPYVTFCNAIATPLPPPSALHNLWMAPYMNKLSAYHAVQQFAFGKTIKVNLLTAAGMRVLTIEPFQS